MTRRFECLLTYSLLAALISCAGCVGSDADQANAAGEQKSPRVLRLEEINVQVERDASGMVTTVDASLARSKFTDAQLNELVEFSELETLILSGTAISDQGLARLDWFRSLRVLVLDDTTVSDAGINQILRCKTLRELSLTSTAVTDAGALKLATLRGLREVVLFQSKTSSKAVKKLRKQLPKARIWH